MTTQTERLVAAGAAAALLAAPFIAAWLWSGSAALIVLVLAPVGLLLILRWLRRINDRAG